MAAFGGLLFGYDTRVLNGALSFMTEYFGIGPAQERPITVTLLIGAGLGALVGGRVSDRIGRRKNTIILAALFFVGALGELEEQERLGGWAGLKNHAWVRRLLFIGIGLAAHQRLTGINLMMCYGTRVLEEAGFACSTALTFHVLNGVIPVGAIGPLVWLMIARSAR